MESPFKTLQPTAAPPGSLPPESPPGDAASGVFQPGALSFSAFQPGASGKSFPETAPETALETRPQKKLDFFNASYAELKELVRETLLADLNAQKRQFLRDPAEYAAARLAEQGKTMEDFSPEARAIANMAHQQYLAKGMEGFTPRVLRASEIVAVKGVLADEGADGEAKFKVLKDLHESYGMFAAEALAELRLAPVALGAFKLAERDPFQELFSAEVLRMAYAGELPSGGANSPQEYRLRLFAGTSEPAVRFLEAILAGTLTRDGEVPGEPPRDSLPTGSQGGAAPEAPWSPFSLRAKPQPPQDSAPLALRDPASPPLFSGEEPPGDALSAGEGAVGESVADGASIDTSIGGETFAGGPLAKAEAASELQQKSAENPENAVERFARDGMPVAIGAFAQVLHRMPGAEAEKLTRAAAASLEELALSDTDKQAAKERVAASPLAKALRGVELVASRQQGGAVSFGSDPEDILRTLECFVALGGNLEELERRIAEAGRSRVEAIAGGPEAPSIHESGDENAGGIAGESARERENVPAVEGSPEGGGRRRSLRGVGIGVRGVVDGAANTADFIASPARIAMSFVNGQLGGDPDYFKPVGSFLSDALHLPKPETDLEHLGYSFNKGGMEAICTVWGATALLAIKPLDPPQTRPGTRSAPWQALPPRRWRAARRARLRRTWRNGPGPGRWALWLRAS